MLRDDTTIILGTSEYRTISADPKRRIGLIHSALSLIAVLYSTHLWHNFCNMKRRPRYIFPKHVQICQLLQCNSFGLDIAPAKLIFDFSQAFLHKSRFIPPCSTDATNHIAERPRKQPERCHIINKRVVAPCHTLGASPGQYHTSS